MISAFWYESSPNYFWKDWNNHVDGLLRNTSRYCIVASEVPLLCLRSFRRLLICEAQKQITFWETILSFAWVNSVFKLNIHVLPVLHNSTYICTQSITLAYINVFFSIRSVVHCPLLWYVYWVEMTNCIFRCVWIRDVECRLISNAILIQTFALLQPQTFSVCLLQNVYMVIQSRCRWICRNGWMHVWLDIWLTGLIRYSK